MAQHGQGGPIQKGKSIDTKKFFSDGELMEIKKQQHKPARAELLAIKRHETSLSNTYELRFLPVCSFTRKVVTHLLASNQNYQIHVETECVETIQMGLNENNFMENISKMVHRFKMS